MSQSTVTWDALTDMPVTTIDELLNAVGSQ